MSLTRNRAAALGQQTLAILQAGSYQTAAGNLVHIDHLLQPAVQSTCSYRPEWSIPAIPSGSKECRIDVQNETTLAVAQRLVEAGHRPAALNFASAKHSGGGFLSGARAQEESLARSSGLYSCLAGNPMYAFHQAHADPMYTSYAIYSPDS